MDRFLIEKRLNELPETSGLFRHSTDIRKESSSSGDLSDVHVNTKSEKYEVTIDSDLQKVKKRKVYKHKFKKEWIDMHPWLEQKESKAFCKVCCRFITGGFKHLGRHNETQAHKRNIGKAKETPKIENYCTKNDESMKSVRRAELKLTMFLHEHNLPFLLMDHLVLLLSVVCPDSKIAKELQCARTKTSNLTHCIAEEQLHNISQILQKQEFSLIIDESTDISGKKSLVLVARYFDGIQNRCRDIFFGLIRVFQSDAKSLFDAICDYLKKLDIPLNMILGLAADNASVMMGNISGVQARFKTILPNIFILGCVCHSFHLCSSAAAKKLPRTLEDFIRSIFAYFSHSSKRLEKLEEFQKFTELKPQKMLHPAQTRWLSLQAAVDRVLEHWDALRLFFQSEYLEENLQASKDIMDSLENPVFKMYVSFLSYVLEQVNKLNLEFQAEKPKLHLLLKRTSDLYRSILRNYVKKTVIENHNLNRIDPSDPRNMLPLENIYFGAKTELLLNNSNIPKQEIYDFKLRALDFYIELSQQVKKRFNFDDPILRFVSTVLDPQVALSGNVNSIVLGAQQYFPNLINDLEKLNSEWRLLPDISELNNIDQTTVEIFWTKVLNIKNEMDEDMFPNLKKLVVGLLSLPHSSAAAERKFSAVNLLKTKLRNRLEIKTINDILHSKENLGENLCYSWEPSKSLCNKKIVYK